MSYHHSVGGTRIDADAQAFVELLESIGNQVGATVGTNLAWRTLAPDNGVQNDISNLGRVECALRGLCEDAS